MVNEFGSILIEEATGATPSDLRRWIEGGMVNVEKEGRLRTAHKVFTILSKVEGPDNARALMFGTSPLLGNNNWLFEIGRGNGAKVLQAAKAYAKDPAIT